MIIGPLPFFLAMVLIYFGLIRAIYSYGRREKQRVQAVTSNVDTAPRTQPAEKRQKSEKGASLQSVVRAEFQYKQKLALGRICKLFRKKYPIRLMVQNEVFVCERPKFPG